MTFTLSIDERTLSWNGNGLINSLTGKQPRSCALYTIVSLLIGRESAVFRRFQGVRAYARTRFLDDFTDPELLDDDQPHLSFSLQFGQSEERDTLDISFDDGQEELFGLWVAAVRAIVPAQALGTDLRKAAAVQPTAAPRDASLAPRLVRPQATPPPQPFEDLFTSLSPPSVNSSAVNSSATVECKPPAPPAEAAVQSPDWTRAPLPHSQPPPQPNTAAAVPQPPPQPPRAPPPRPPPPQQPPQPPPPAAASPAPAPAPASLLALALARPAKPAPTPLAWKPPPEVLEEDEEEEPPPPPVVVPAAFGYVAPAGSTASSDAGAPPVSMAPVDWAGILASTFGGSDSLRSLQGSDGGGSGGLGDLDALFSAQPPPSAGHGAGPTLAKTSRDPFSELAL